MPAFAPAAGQACVLYSDEGEGARILGGGFIERTEREESAERQLGLLLASPAMAAAG
jgi:tRNA-uridine 2-sulfurtransferase